MKTLVVYYSRTGVTRKVAEALAGALQADVEEIIDTKSRKGPIGFAGGVKDALMKKIVPIQPHRCNGADYDLVVIGTPVWVNTMSSAVRTYLSECGKNIKKAAVFCTTHTSGIEKTNANISDMLAGDTIASAGFLQKDVKQDKHLGKMEGFLDKIRGENETSTEPAKDCE